MELQFLTEDIKVFLQMYEWNTHDKAQARRSDIFSVKGIFYNNFARKHTVKIIY